MKITIIGEFEPEEIEAIKVISEGKCLPVLCRECPWNDTVTGNCIVNMARRILEKNREVKK